MNKRPSTRGFSPTQESLDRLSSKLNQRFFDEKLKRLPRELQEWEDRHSIGRALRSIKLETVSWRSKETKRSSLIDKPPQDFPWVWLPVILLIFLVMLVAFLVEILFFPLTLILLLIRRSRTKPTMDGLPKISLRLDEVATFAELKSSVDGFVASHGKLFDEVSWDMLAKLSEESSQDLIDPDFEEVSRITDINEKLGKCRIWIRERRWRFLYPDRAAKADARKLDRSMRITPVTGSKSFLQSLAMEKALSETARVQEENSALAALILDAKHPVDDSMPPHILLLEYHVSDHPQHSVSIYKSPADTTITTTKFSPSMASSSPLFESPLELAECYCETEDFKTGSFMRNPSAHQWAEFNKTIRELDLARYESDIGERAPDRTSWTLFIHYGDRFVFAGDSTRGTVGNKVATAVAKLIT